MTLVELWIETLKLVGDNERRQLIRDYYCRLQLSSTPLDGYIMSWDEAREMQKHGIRFGSHTHSHIILKGLLPELIETELRKSGELISEKLQIEVDSFCYPNGRYNRKEGDILSLCGYSYGFCLDNMSLQCCDDKHYIPRFLVSERNTTNQAYFKLRLLEVPFYSPKPHNPHAEEP
jgi:peptidoglycan/xylan/chitin deacetylase (PgdA/CDA1 family)